MVCSWRIVAEKDIKNGLFHLRNHNIYFAAGIHETHLLNGSLQIDQALLVDMDLLVAEFRFAGTDCGGSGGEADYNIRPRSQ